MDETLGRDLAQLTGDLEDWYRYLLKSVEIDPECQTEEGKRSRLEAESRERLGRALAQQRKAAAGR